MKYKAGDKVRIKSREEIEKVADFKSGWNEDMFDYCGLDAIILDIDYDGSYTLDVDKRRWYWDDEMFEDSFELNLPKHTIIRRKFSKISNVIY